MGERGRRKEVWGEGGRELQTSLADAVLSIASTQFVFVSVRCVWWGVCGGVCGGVMCGKW